MMAADPVLSVVVPLFNEQENLAELHRRLTATLDDLGVDAELVFVNDGSWDETPALLDRLAARDGRLVVVHLSRNFGHQPAIWAGLEHSHGAAVIVMDGDLQDPPEVLDQFLAKWREGYDVVYAVRTKRKEGVLKRTGYFLFYRLLRAISDVEIPLDSGDFCLMDRKVVEALQTLPERQRFLRGLRSFVGFRQVGLRYERASRGAGQPKYTFRALLKLAVDGVVGFSSVPLRLISYLGLLSAVMTVAAATWVLLGAWTDRTTPADGTGLMLIVLVVAAVQLICLGIMGEYLQRIFAEVTRRPTYITREVVHQARGLKRELASSKHRQLG